MSSYGNLFKSAEDQKGMTPKWLLRRLEQKFNKGKQMFDPCPRNWNIKKHGDGLQIKWKNVNYVNPPFDNTGAFFNKAIIEAKQKKLSVFLVPTRFHTRFFQNNIEHMKHISIFTKNVAFEGYDKPLPCCLCLVIFGPYRSPSNKYLHFANVPSPATLNQVKSMLLAVYNKSEIAMLNHSISEPIQKCLGNKKAIYCPARLDNRVIQEKVLPIVKDIIFLSPCLRRTAKDDKFMNGSMILIFHSNSPLLKHEFVNPRKVPYNMFGV